MADRQAGDVSEENKRLTLEVSFVRCVTQQTCLLYHTADMCAVSHSWISGFCEEPRKTQEESAWDLEVSFFPGGGGVSQQNGVVEPMPSPR